jgi:ATP-binding cassette subfamily F protein 3
LAPKVEDLTIFQVDGALIVDASKLQLVSNRVYALFGNNGAGKTTLVNAIAEGKMGMPENVNVCVVEQVCEKIENVTDCIMFLRSKDVRLERLRKQIAGVESASGGDVDEEKVANVLSDLLGEEEELEQSQEARCKSCLAKVGFTEIRMRRNPKCLSGGWIMRLRIAVALLSEASFFILDETTSFLDAAGIQTLQHLICDVLRSENTFIVVVSHNRAFLEAVSTDTIMLARKKLFTHNVPFDVFLAAAREREAHQTARYERQQIEVQKMRATVAKVGSLFSFVFLVLFFRLFLCVRFKGS